jgi:hypothetical protein
MKIDEELYHKSGKLLKLFFLGVFTNLILLPITKVGSSISQN